MTNYIDQLITSRHLNRFNVVATLSIICGVIWVGTLLGVGWMIHNELIYAYAQNVNILADAGFVDIITAPDVLTDRLMLIMLFIPVLGAVITVPIIGIIVIELTKLKTLYTNL